jgi:hypothetical protein
VRIGIAPSQGIQVAPASLFFEATKGVDEAQSQELSITSAFAYTVQLPVWLQSYENSGRLFIDPVNTDSFAPGTYQEDIVLTSQEGEVRVPVTYKINANGFTDLLRNHINFTLDGLKVNYASLLSRTYVKVRYNIAVYDRAGAVVFKNHVTDVPLFNGKGFFVPGVLVGSLMPTIEEVAPFLGGLGSDQLLRPFSYYRSADVAMTLEERNLSDEAVQETVYLTNYLFQIGVAPAVFENSMGIPLNQGPLRVTRNSLAMFNFYREKGAHTLELHKNGVLLQRIAHTALQSSGYGMLLGFAAHKEGDLIQVKLADGNGGFHVRQYYVFPEGKESYHVAWVTANNQMELMECTGALAIGSEYTGIENLQYKDLVDVTEVLEVRKAQRVKVNTGWILKNNFPFVDSIARSKRAWLVINGQYVPMVPQSTKLANYDSETALYAYELDFKINPEHDYKVYTR